MQTTMINVLHPIYVTARTYPDRPAFALADRVITYRDFVSHVASAADHIIELGLDRSRVVAVSIRHPVIHLIILAALMKEGYATASVPEQAANLMLDVGATDALTDADAQIEGVRAHRYDDRWITRRVNLADWRVIEPAGNQVMRVSLTSGSTGVRKPIAHSYAAMSRSIEWETFWKVGAERVVLSQFGVQVLVGFDLAFGLLRLGRTICIAPNAPTAVQMIAKHSVELIAGSSAQVLELLAHQRKMRVNVRSVRRITTGGGPISASDIADLRIAFEAGVDVIYASTEAGTAGISAGDMLKRRPGEGRYVVTSQVKIVDPLTLEPASEGLLGIRSDVMGAPFHAGGDLHLPAHGDEWFYPGDVGFIDADGLLAITGRFDEVINAGGVKFAPEIIEAALIRHPDIRDAAVVRIDGASGQLPQVCVALIGDVELTASALTAWLAAQKINVPISRTRRVDSIPRGGMEKIARQDVRRLFSAS